jgi:maltose O-acetyltransferase
MNFFNNLLIKLYKKAKLLERNDRYNQFRQKYKLSKSFKFNGDNIVFYGSGDIVAGNNSYIGEFSTLQTENGTKIFIGKNCSISHNVRVYTTSVIPDNNWAVSEKIIKRGDVIIEDYAWIGANVFINPGVTIGENAVVGANSVVTRDIPAFSIVGGVPAKIIRMKKFDA